MPATRSSAPIEASRNESDLQRGAVDAVILAGGKGERLGRGEKGLALLAGRPMLTRVCDRIAPQVRHGAVCANRCLAAYRQSVGWPLIQDAPVHLGAGPLAGVAAALGYFKQAEWVLVVPCDTPLLPSDLVTRLLDAGSAEHDILYAADHQREHFAVALIRPRVRGALNEALAGGTRRLQDFYAQQRAASVLFEDAAAFININTAAELDALSEHLSV